MKIQRLDLATLRFANVLRCEESYGYKPEQRPLPEWLTALCGEMGEIAHLINDFSIGEWEGKEEEFKKRLAEEIADTTIYLDLLADAAQIDTSLAIEEKFNRKSKELGSLYFLVALPPETIDIIG